MSVHVLTYDLIDPGQNYDDVMDFIRQHGYAQLSESTYAIATEKTVNDLYQEMRQITDDSDQFYIVTLTPLWAGYGPEEVNEWLDNHLS